MEIKTLQEWIEWAENIDNSADVSDDSQYEKELVAVDDILEDIESIFSEGFYNYIHNVYGSDDMDVNDKMIKDIDDKVKILKKALSKTNHNEGKNQSAD